MHVPTDTSDIDTFLLNKKKILRQQILVFNIIILLQRTASKKIQHSAGQEIIQWIVMEKNVLNNTKTHHEGTQETSGNEPKDEPPRELPPI